MKEAFKHIGWFLKLRWRKYLLCAITLLIVSVTPTIPAKILGLAIDEIAMGTITSEKLIWYLLGLFLFPFTTYLINIVYHYTINSLGHDLSFILREKYIEHLLWMHHFMKNILKEI